MREKIVKWWGICSLVTFFVLSTGIVGNLDCNHPTTKGAIVAWVISTISLVVYLVYEYAKTKEEN